MPRKNELLEKKINETIQQARYQPPQKEKTNPSLFYTIIVLLVTLAVLFSLFRFL